MLKWLFVLFLAAVIFGGAAFFGYNLFFKQEIAVEKEKKGEIHTSELQSGFLFRSIQFPKKIDTEKVKAELKNGMLTITAPLAEEAKTTKANIQTA